MKTPEPTSYWHPYLEQTHAISLTAMDEGRHPFGAVLVGADGEVLMEQGNLGTVRHAETELARRASETYDPETLWSYTLVTNGEPCAMCMGTIYWANIGRVVYGFSETDLLDLTGAHEENPTLNLPCRTVVAAGQKDIEIIGPFPELRETLLEPHRNFWK
ncbi:MAG: nucleoside deaminase [Opitutales bacterium]|nr:nucleoside deaminase [Opitutales bacterium]NRA26460.1 nucleoside deaminase [Opitutales bacterium]